MNARILKLKQKLLDEQLVEDSAYLAKYINLLQDNLTTMQIKHVTQAHHAIPVSYYKHFYPGATTSRNRRIYENLASNDLTNFVVNLKYSDHLLAHCYLALCAIPNWFKYANANMITAVSKHTELEAFTTLENLSDFQKAYTLNCQLKQGKTLSEEHKAKIAEAHRKENMTAEYSQKLSEANHNRVWMAESKVKISNTLKNNQDFQKMLYARNTEKPPAKGLIWVTNGVTTTRIDPATLSDYLAMGYWAGKKNTLQIHKGYQEITIHASLWPLYEAQGWKKYWKLSKNDRIKYITSIKEETY